MSGTSFIERTRRDAAPTLGAAPVPTTTWRGLDGLRRLQTRVRVAAPDPSAFEASWASVVVDGMQVAAWTCSPLSGARPPLRTPAPVQLLVVARGRIRYWAAGRAVDGDTGSVHLLSGGDPVRFGIPAPSRMLVVSLPAAHLASDLRAAVGTSIGGVPGSRITDGLVALVEQVLDAETGGPECAAARAVCAVAAAAVEDSVPDGTDRDLRARILEHIEQRIGDPDLGPQAIAAEFGISLRWVHQVFNVDGSSIARHIRERRLDLVAERLRSDRRFPRIGALAERSGFGSRDQLTRAFKARFGMTIGEYAALADLGRLPAPPAPPR